MSKKSISLSKKREMFKVKRSVDEEHKWSQGGGKIWGEPWKLGRISNCKKGTRKHFKPKEYYKYTNEGRGGRACSEKSKYSSLVKCKTLGLEQW